MTAKPKPLDPYTLRWALRQVDPTQLVDCVFDNGLNRDEALAYVTAYVGDIQTAAKARATKARKP